MSKIFLLFFLICLKSISNQGTVSNYSNFFNKVSPEERSEEENNCLCDIERDACNYLCCCDKKCNETSIEFWRSRSKCIDEKDTVGIFSDRCIDKHLLILFNGHEDKKYRRRGLERIKATEDISNSIETLDNFCFSMDNSDKMKKEIKQMNIDVDKLKQNTQNGNSAETNSNSNNRKSYKYLSINKDKNIINKNSALRANDEVNIEINNSYFNVFNNNDSFSLYAGSICSNNNKVEKLKNVNYSCSMSKALNENITKALNYSGNNIYIGKYPCSKANIYRIKNGLLSFASDTDKNIYENETVSEVEFFIQLNNYDDEYIGKCTINIVTMPKENNKNNSIFKNSVIFSQNLSVPYRYSGVNGYLNNFPLKIYNGIYVFNEFYIVGRDNDGHCRTDNNSYDYLYFYDKPILFNQNYSYSCSFNNSNISTLNDFTLIKKLNVINKIARYGNSNYNKINNETLWRNIDKSGLNESEINNTLIKMNIYLGTRKIGIYSYKYIYKVILKNVYQRKNDTLTLDINFYDLDKKQDYQETPELPAFIPSMPGDLLDPLIYSNVDK